MNRIELQEIAELRVVEAQLLFDNRRFEGAYYLLGYALECAFKACVAKQIHEHDFPDRKFVNDSYTHDLEKLLNVSGLKVEHEKQATRSPAFELNWTVVKDWSEEARYLGKISEKKVRDFFSAVLDEQDGVLPWLKKWW